MAKTSEAQLKAVKKYNEKSKYIHLKFTENRINEYNRICKYCNDNGYSLQGYIRDLINSDLDSKNIPYSEAK